MLQTIVMLLIFGSSFLVWKWVKDFYQLRYSNVLSHLVAIATASFMFLGSMMLFVPKDYVKGITPEVDISVTSIGGLLLMLGLIFYFFKYRPSKESKNS